MKEWIKFLNSAKDFFSWLISQYKSWQKKRKIKKAIHDVKNGNTKALEDFLSGKSR